MKQHVLAMAHALAFVLTATLSASLNAATFTIDAGKLTSASGVIVAGSSYDVTFSDGTCISLFGGCDEETDLTFPSVEIAHAASLALLDQVYMFLPQVNEYVPSGPYQPDITNGCSLTIICNIHTAYYLDSYGWVGTSQLRIEYDQLGVVNGGLLATGETPNNKGTWAIWSQSATVPSPVPEPETYAMLIAGLGLLGLVARRRRQKLNA